jgi:hypothetical protein
MHPSAMQTRSKRRTNTRYNTIHRPKSQDPQKQQESIHNLAYPQSKTDAPKHNLSSKVNTKKQYNHSTQAS